MAGESPDVVIYDVNGNMLAVQNGSAIPASTPALMIAGSDGTNSRYFAIDSSGRPIMVGAGIAGSPTGGVLSIQGVASGTAVPISGTVSISGTVGVTQSTSPWVDNITQFGGTNISTGTGAGGAGIPRVTVSNDSNILATQSGTWTVTATQTTASNLNAAVVGIGTAGTPSGGVLSIQGVAGGTNIPVTVATPDTTATGSLNALNATVPIVLAATAGVAMQLNAGTLIGTIVPEISFDGGTTWVATFFDDPSTGNKVSSIVFASNNTATTRVLASADGASNMRVRVSAFTSGTATCNLRGSSQEEPSVLFSGTAGGVLPPTIAQVGGTDGSNLRAISTDTSGHPVIVGPGTAGSPAGGVVSIQGVASGTNVPVSQGTSPWVDNITQFGGTNLSTGTGAGGAGIPRVTVSNDSNILATQSGTWTVQPGNTANTTPWLVTDSSDGPVTPGAVASKSSLMGGQFNTSLPTLTNTQQSAIQLDSSGRVLIGAIPTGSNTIGAVTQGTSPWVDNITQFGGTNISTGTGAGGAGIPRVTVSNDSNILATQSGTWTVAQGAPNTTANAWPTKVTDGTNTAAVKAASTAAVAADPSLVVTASPNSVDINDTVGAAGTLNALNATATVSLANQSSVGMQLAAGTLVGTIVPEISLDGGTTWAPTFFDDPATDNKVSSIVFSSSNTATTRTIVGWGGSSNARVRVSAFTSGTASCTLRASKVDDPSVLFAGPFSSTTQPPTAAQIAGWDGSTLRVPTVKAPSTAAAATDQALVVSLSPNSSGSSITTTTPLGDIAFGYLATSAKTFLPIRATTYTQITGAPVQVSVKSTSAHDSSADTGSRTITITYLTTGSVRKTETITMNGTTAVNSVNTDYAFIEKVITSTAGSNRTNVGTITVFQGTGGTGTALCSIAIGDGRTNYCHHYVPTGKTCYITGLQIAFNAAANGTIALYLTNPTETDVLEIFVGQFRTATQLASNNIILNSPIKVPQSDITNGSFIIAYVTPDATTATTFWVGFTFYEI